MKVRFGNNIRGLFRPKDRNVMLNTRHELDLWDHAQVSLWADRILAQLDGGAMPCDGAWPAEKVAVFRKWIADGKLP